MTAVALNSAAAEFDPPSPSLEDAVGDRSGRFTIDGDDALEAGLAVACSRIVSGIRGLVPDHRLEAIILGGGYGRGEGGVLRGGAGDSPYNDLEFYVAIRGSRHVNEARFHRRLEVLGEILTHLAAVEVEFKITSLAEIASKPVSMFSYDLACGHRVVWKRDGADLYPIWKRHDRSGDIPLSEATRLLMNRCTGLLLARAELDQGPLTPKSADFVRRNIAKAQLACGDAVLVAHKRYHWSCRERHRRLSGLSQKGSDAVSEQLLRHHAAGVEFKLHPTNAAMPLEKLVALHSEVTAMARDWWLSIEAQRLGRPFPSVRAYVTDEGDKCPGSPALLNVVLNLRADGAQGRRAHSFRRHPRGRLYVALAILLWEPDAATDGTRAARLEAVLGSKPTSSGGWINAYRRLWERVR